MSESIAMQMERLMQQYGDAVHEIVESSAEDAANIAKNQLRNTSPKENKRHRHYASGWTVKKEIGSELVSFTVHNRTKPGLTHLLEYGHVIRNKKGRYGRTRPIKHIKPAEETAVMKFELRVRAKLRSLQ